MEAEEVGEDAGRLRTVLCLFLVNQWREGGVSAKVGI